MQVTLPMLNNRLRPCDLPNSFLNGASKASNSSPLNLDAKPFLSSLTLWVRGKSQNRFAKPQADAVVRIAIGAVVIWNGAVKARISGEIDCIWKKVGKTLFCKTEKLSLSRALNAIGEAT